MVPSQHPMVSKSYMDSGGHASESSSLDPTMMFVPRRSRFSVCFPDVVDDARCDVFRTIIGTLSFDNSADRISDPSSDTGGSSCKYRCMAGRIIVLRYAFFVGIRGCTSSIWISPSASEFSISSLWSRVETCVPSHLTCPHLADIHSCQYLRLLVYCSLVQCLVHMATVIARRVTSAWGEPRRRSTHNVEYHSCLSVLAISKTSGSDMSGTESLTLLPVIS